MIKSSLFILLLLQILSPSINCLFHYRTDTRITAGHDPTGFFFQNSIDDQFRFLRNFIESCPQPEGHCETQNPTLPASNLDLCGPGASSRIFWIIEIKFSAVSETIYRFNFVNIFSQFAALFIDDQPAPFPSLPSSTNDPAEFEFAWEFCEGTHTIKLYAQEDISISQKELNIGVSMDNQGSLISKELGNCYVPNPRLISQVETKKLPGCLEKPFSPEAFGEHLIHEFKRNFIAAIGPNAGPYCTFYTPIYPFLHQPLCTGPIPPFGAIAIGADRDIFWLINIQFSVSVESEIEFQFGMKFDSGYAVFIDDCFDQASKDPIDWAQDFSNTDQLITVKSTFKPGYHQVKLYGRDISVNQEQHIRFLPPGAAPGAYVDLRIEEWDIAFPNNFLNVRLTSRRLNIAESEGDKSKFPDDLEEVFEEALQPTGYCRSYDVSYPFSNSFECAKGASKNLLYKIDFVIHEDFQAEYEFIVKGNFQLGAKVLVNGALNQTLEPIHEPKIKRYWRRFRKYTRKGYSKSRTLKITVPTDSDQKIFKVSIYAAEFKSGKVNAKVRRNGGKFKSIEQISQEIPFEGCPPMLQF